MNKKISVSPNNSMTNQSLRGKKTFYHPSPLADFNGSNYNDRLKRKGQPI